MRRNTTKDFRNIEITYYHLRRKNRKNDDDDNNCASFANIKRQLNQINAVGVIRLKRAKKINSP